MSTFSVTRAANGQIILSMQNMSKYNVANVGTMSGNLDFSLGQTGDSDESVLQVASNTGLEFNAAGTTDSFEFDGSGVDAKFNQKADAAYNVAWNVKNGSFDSSKSNNTVIFQAGEDSANNVIKTGTSTTKLMDAYNNVIVDGGKNNTYIADDNSSNRYETTSTSETAAILAGDGKNDFFVGGKNGVFVGGSGVDRFITQNGTADRNLMIGADGADEVYDYGSNSMFIGGAGKDTVAANGTDGLFNAGFDEEANVSIKGSGNAVFTGAEQTDSNGKVYKYADILKLRGWDMDNFFKFSDIEANPYFSLVEKALEDNIK
ncbi:MAG: hypothetical protein PHV37_01625 [Candidatus Gastranaerophilales bacterium]|nr:hypothetical protein [Candidatus Gastranaerophilales bacterium]